MTSGNRWMGMGRPASAGSRRRRPEPPVATLDAGLRQGEHLGQRHAVGQQVGGHQFVAHRDHDRFAHPQAQRDRGVAVKRQAVLVAHGGQKEIQHDRLVGQSRGVLPQKAAINPRPALPRRAAHAVGNQDWLGNHGSSPLGNWGSLAANDRFDDNRGPKLTRGTQGKRPSRHRQGRDRGNASSLRPCIRAGVPRGPSGCCAATTCGRGRGSQPWPRGKRHYSTRRTHTEIPARARNIPAGRRNFRGASLLRDHAQAWRRQGTRYFGSLEVALPAARRLGTPCVCAAAVPLRHAVGALRDPLDVSAAAWRPASDATRSNIPALGNSVGCNVLLETFARSLCGDKCAVPVADPWYAHRLPWYAEIVPWEVTTPWGRPRRIAFPPRALCPSSIVRLPPHPLTVSESLRAEIRRTKTARTGKVLQQGKLCRPEGNREGDGADESMPRRRPLKQTC